IRLKAIVSLVVVFVIALGVQLSINRPGENRAIGKEIEEKNEEMEEDEAAYQYLRWKYEADMIKDPTTGEALFGLRNQEVEFARTIPQRNTSSLARLTTQNNYLPAGPNNTGGRTRAIAYDIRYNGTSNR